MRPRAIFWKLSLREHCLYFIPKCWNFHIYENVSKFGDFWNILKQMSKLYIFSKCTKHCTYICLSKQENMALGGVYWKKFPDSDCCCQCRETTSKSTVAVAGPGVKSIFRPATAQDRGEKQQSSGLYGSSRLVDHLWWANLIFGADLCRPSLLGADLDHSYVRAPVPPLRSLSALSIALSSATSSAVQCR